MKNNFTCTTKLRFYNAIQTSVHFSTQQIESWNRLYFYPLRLNLVCDEKYNALMRMATSDLEKYFSSGDASAAKKKKKKQT